MDEGLEMRLHHNILQDAAHRPFCTNRIPRRRSTRHGTLDRFVLLNVEGHLSPVGLALLFAVMSRVQCYPVLDLTVFRQSARVLTRTWTVFFL